MTGAGARGEGQPLRYKEARGTGKFSCGWRLNHVFPSKLAVPFRCSLEAEMARITMDGENDQQAVQREMKIMGSALSVSVVEGVHSGVRGGGWTQVLRG